MEVRRREGEKFESLLRRFNRLVQASRLLKNFKESRFYQKPETKRKKRESALRKMKIKKIRGYY